MENTYTNVVNDVDFFRAAPNSTSNVVIRGLRISSSTSSTINSCTRDSTWWAWTIWKEVLTDLFHRWLLHLQYREEHQYLRTNIYWYYGEEEKWKVIVRRKVSLLHTWKSTSWDRNLHFYLDTRSEHYSQRQTYWGCGVIYLRSTILKPIYTLQMFCCFLPRSLTIALYDWCTHTHGMHTHAYLKWLVAEDNMC